MLTSFKVEWEVKSSNPRHRTTVKEGERWVWKILLSYGRPCQLSMGATIEKLTKSSNHGTPVPINKNLLPFETIVIFIIIKLLFPAGPSTLLILLNLRVLFGNLIGNSIRKLHTPDTLVFCYIIQFQRLQF